MRPLHRPRLLSCALLALYVLLAAPGPHAAPTRPWEAPSAERLLELADEARALVAEHYGESAEALDTPVRVVEREALVATLETDLRPQLAIQFGEEGASETVELAAEVMGGVCLARYAFAAGEVLICRENIEELAAVLEIPALESEETLRAVLVHEFVHARDAREVDFAARVAACADTDQLQAMNAVIEGHAQYVTRAIAVTHELEAAFEVFAGAISKVPPSLTEPALRTQAEVAASAFAFAYEDGERFVRAVAEARGPEALPLLFSEPPRDPTEILRPEYFLDPASRPELTVAIDRGLDHFQVVAIPEPYRVQRMSILRPQLEVSMKGVDQALLETTLDALVGCRALFGMNPEQPGAFLSAAVMEFETPGLALTGLRAQRAVLLLRDEQNREGAIRITDVTYTDLQLEDGARGILSEKVVETPIGEQEGITVLLVREAAMVELTSFEDSDDVDQLIAWGDEILSVSLGLMEPAEADEAATDPPAPR